MNKLKVEAAKFTIVGSVNFFLTFIVFTVMLKILYVNYLISLSSAWAIGFIFSYIVNFSWVFKPDKKIQFRGRFIKYFFASSFSLGMNILVLSLVVSWSGFDAYYAQMLLMPIIVTLNFFTAKYWSLRKS
ncbi:GtrA family protein [Polynucleobacter sp. 71A-WALBACH]|uniref:GtrA family protein n=1 Tax=Polynucleobacter sp. 71A-WALBACH TaxID=2689097 RepID=UPI001C0B16EB|nr:GtrA family protein [Polynucleobacter sp. 71A-WALBACH]